MKCPECNWKTEKLFIYGKGKKGMCANCMCEELLFKGIIEVKK